MYFWGMNVCAVTFTHTHTKRCIQLICPISARIYACAMDLLPRCAPASTLEGWGKPQDRLRGVQGGMERVRNLFFVKSLVLHWLQPLLNDFPHLST